MTKANPVSYQQKPVAAGNKKLDDLKACEGAIRNHRMAITNRFQQFMLPQPHYDQLCFSIIAHGCYIPYYHSGNFEWVIILKCVQELFWECALQCFLDWFDSASFATFTFAFRFPIITHKCFAPPRQESTCHSFVMS